ncbi:MAG: hypothetical protein GYA15_13325 [Leptolinea sp.]|jgi:bacterioferritin (cytochrome b1)|nr:hypothetical protein [Leptolinea sp.]
MFKRIGLLSLISSLITVSVFCLQPAGQVLAALPADDNAPPQNTAPVDETDTGKTPQEQLQRLFQQEKKNHEKQKDVISKAENARDKLTELIARAKKNGKETKSMEKALAQFNTRLGEIRLTYDQMEQVIRQHAGFDDKGKVVNAENAKKTVVEIRQGNKEIRQSLVKALKDIGQAGKKNRQQNNPRPAAKPSDQTS